MGLFDFLKTCKRKGLTAPVSEKSQESHDANIKLTYEIAVREPSVEEVIFSDLHKEATSLGRAGDLSGAIDKLYKANQIEHEIGIEYGVKRSLRLPLFLQKAGRFNEAMVEFHTVIDDLPEQLKRMSPTISKNVKDAGLQSDLSVVYDKMRLACKREGRLSEANEHARTSEMHSQQWEALHVKIDAEDKAQSAAWEKRMHKAGRRVKTK